MQSLAIAQAGGTPQAMAFSGVMTGLWEACGLMSQGFQEACLSIEVVVQKTILEATAQDRAFTAKATKDLDLWTAALSATFLIPMKSQKLTWRPDEHIIIIIIIIIIVLFSFIHTLLLIESRYSNKVAVTPISYHVNVLIRYTNKSSS